jgi:uncharacterized protein YuzE
MEDSTYDRDANAMYVYFQRGKKYRGTKRLDWSRFVDYADDDTIIGVELLNVHRGVSLEGLPEPERIARALAEHRVEIREAQPQGN